MIDRRLGRGPLAAIASLVLATGAAHALYLPPANPWITAPDERRVTVSISSGSLSDAQSRIDGARNDNPGAVLVIALNGTYTVTSQPLRLPSLSSLVLNGTIRAGGGATAPALISITSGSRVAVAGGTLDGAGANLSGLVVTNSSKINIDRVTVIDTGRDGISLDGAGNTEATTGMSVVRCTVSGSRMNGIVVKELTQAVVVDNSVQGSTGAGIDVRAAHSVVTNNSVSNSGTGILLQGTDNAASKNTLSGNGTGVRLGSTATNNSCFQNSIAGSAGDALALAGTNNLLYANALSGNARNLASGGSGNYVVPDTLSLAAAGNNYFFPPTIGNRHTNPTVMNGRTRRNLNINGTSLANVQAQYNSLRAANPNDVIVLTLTGTFSHSGAPLTLQSFTALVLNGTINVQPSASRPVISGPAGTSFISVSGGTLNGNGMPAPAVQLQTVMSYVDHVTLRNFGTEQPRTSGGVIHVRGSGGYTIVRGNRVDVSGGRCIWTQNSGKRYLVLDNHTSNCNMDGIDFDSHTSNSIARGNRSEDNTRYGLFIEEGASHNKAWDNDLVANSIGVNMFSFASGGTEQNTVFMNRLSGNLCRGIRLGSMPDHDTSRNFIFNNSVVSSETALSDGSTGVDNYFSQNRLSGNVTDLSIASGSTVFFNSIPAPGAVNLALNRPVTVSDEQLENPGPNAVDGDVGTRWSADTFPQSLEVDLGSVRRVGRTEVVGFQDRAYRFVVEVKTSVGGASVRVVDRSLNTTPGTVASPITDTFPGVDARFVKITVIGASGYTGTWTSLPELRVFEAP